MHKKYIVRLTNEERERLRSVIKKLKGSSQKVRRAQVLLKADADGPGWTDARIAEAFDCRTKTVENIRQRLVRDGFESALNGKQRESPPVSYTHLRAHENSLHLVCRLLLEKKKKKNKTTRHPNMLHYFMCSP